MVHAKAAATCLLPTSLQRMETASPRLQSTVLTFLSDLLSPPFWGDFCLLSVTGRWRQQYSSSVFQWHPNAWSQGPVSQCLGPVSSVGTLVFSENSYDGKNKHRSGNWVTRINNPSLYIQALIMQITNQQRTGTDLLSGNHANTHVLMLLFFRSPISWLRLTEVLFVVERLIPWPAWPSSTICPYASTIYIAYI